MKEIKVRYSKLGKCKSWGLAHYDDNSIELDVRLKGKKHGEILAHEVFHLLFPDLEEDEIVKKSIILINTFWAQGWKRVDDSNDIPMQDGTI